MVNCIENWAQSEQGQQISLHLSSEKLEDLSKPILFIGGVHGDEPEGVYLAQDTLKWLKSQDKGLLHSWALITCINPDGYQKNTRVNSRGVDLNRNFPSSNWSKDHEKQRYFPGTQPASEKETQALVELIQEIKPQLIIHAHSWKPCIVCTGEPGLPAAEKLSQASGFEITHDIGYPTPGSLSAYGWKDNQIPIICTEDEEHRDPTKPWPRFGDGIKKIFLED